MTDLDKAREWAERMDKIEGLMPGHRAAAEVIQSLPDQWIDAEKLREAVSKYEGNRYISEIVQDFADLLPTPKLPTLAELIKQGNDPEQYRWMQAKVFHTEELGCITNFDLSSECATVLFPNGVVKSVLYEDTTPLTGEPKLKWPGGGVDGEIVEEPDDVAYATGGALTTQDVVDECRAVRKERALPKPEDVPANEPWLIEVGDQKAIGTRDEDDEVVPWSVAALDGSFVVEYHDSVVTLIHKLAPETPALPEGMRLADHEEYGRVLVSPKADKDGEYMIFFPRYNYGENGSDYEYAHKSKLTFLGGDQHV